MMSAIDAGILPEDSGGSREGGDEPAGPVGDTREDTEEAEGTCSSFAVELGALGFIGDAEVDGGDKRNNGAGELRASGISDDSVGTVNSYATDIDGSGEKTPEAAAEAPTTAKKVP